MTCVDMIVLHENLSKHCKGSLDTCPHVISSLATCCLKVKYYMYTYASKLGILIIVFNSNPFRHKHLTHWILLSTDDVFLTSFYPITFGQEIRTIRIMTCLFSHNVVSIPIGYHYKVRMHTSTCFPSKS